MAEPGTLRGGGLAHGPGADRLRRELERYLVARTECALAAAGRLLGRSAAVLTGLAQGDAPLLGDVALDYARRIVRGRGPLRAAVAVGASRLLRTARRPPPARPSITVASVDVGVPVREAYDRWARRPDLAGADLAGPGRPPGGGTVHVTDRTPGERIAWTREGAGGSACCVVTFHALAEDLTRVLLTEEHRPRGPAARVAGLWGAQDRRARLGLEAYARSLALPGDPRDEGGTP
ncbi:cyclase/dehydrase [Streptomyces sp. NPDC012888]|uniref:cyclase/dehydrase n=1 Tax=Streptomyces sp. NPDC012888 TaxID=3364855 RepID=UPI0036A48E86